MVVCSPPIVLALAMMLGLADGATTRLEVAPDEVRLSGSDSMAQAVVTGWDARGRPADLTATARYRVEDDRVARVDAGGLVRPAGDGTTRLVVEAGGRAATVAVVVADMANARPVHFVGEVVPILTRFGCNAGGCHGKSSGQNGFRLSLLGFDPRSDYEALVREGRGRRVFPADPGRSLFLRKPTAQVPHGGGKRFPVAGPEYQTIVRWIGQGMPFESGKEPRLLRVEVEPARRVIPRHGRQQIRATAHYEDGTSADVTRMAQYQSNASDLALVGETGVVEALDGVGEAAIMARYGGLVGVARATVPLSQDPVAWAEPASTNPLDPLVFRKLRELGVEPSGPCTDTEFARRSSLDLCGILPDPADVAAFERDADPEKRSKWVDRLIDRPEYADLFAMKWSTILKNKRTLGPVSQAGTFAFHGWIRQSMAENKPYDRFVAEIVAARGEPSVNPAVLWYRQVDTLEARVDDTAQLFLGMRIQCARCHHHPFERWSQDDYYGFASIFTRIGNKGDDPSNPRLYVLPAGLATNPISGKEKAPRALGAPEMADLTPGDDPRERLADWFGRPDNPYFARALVNRYWKHFFGRGLVEPEDDMRASNPPSNPELLDALAGSFVRSGYDLKALVRLIATSRAYDRSSLPNATNAKDRRNFARFYAKRLPAEVLLDALNLVAGTREPFEGLPPSFRATQLPDDVSSTEFLAIFGRPKRESVCECERSAEANLTQTLHLLNSSELQQKLGSGGGRATRWAADGRPDAEKVEELYRTALTRPPSADEREVCLAHLARRRAEKKPKQGYEDLIWAVINSKEFLFVH